MNNINKNPGVVLRETEPSDLETLFTQQLDEDYAHMAAFVNENWRDKDAYLAKWNILLKDETVNIRTIAVDNKVAGSVLTWQREGELQIAYGVGKEHWGKGIATTALQQFLSLAPQRPIYGSLAYDNIGSAKVLVKCGFKQIGEETSFAFARQKEITEIVFLLEA